MGALCFPFLAHALTPNDTPWKATGAPHMINLTQAWDIATDARKVVIGVIDSGVDITHPDLAENIWVNSEEKLDGVDNDDNGYIDDLNGWDFVKNSPNVRPNPTAASSTKIGIQHGTVVAGIIGAVGNNAQAGAGVAWKVRIMPLKILGEDGDGDSDMAVKAIDYAINKKVDIINLSFVGKTPSRNFIQAMRRAYRAGITVVAAAGNAPEHGLGLNLDVEPQYPVCFDDPLQEENWVIGVAALSTQGELALFSNYGARCIDIAAPGTRIPSLLFFEPAHGFFDLYGGTWSGTSVAAPYVTGVAALIKGLQPTWGPEQIRKALVENVDSISGNDGREAGRGVLNAFKAVRFAARGGSGGVTTEGTLLTVSQVRGVPYATLFDSTLRKVSSFPLARVGVTQVVAQLADVENVGVSQIIASVPDSRGTLIRIFGRDGVLIREFRPFGRAVRTALPLAHADVNGDGMEEMVVASVARRMVRVIRADGSVLSEFSVPQRGPFSTFIIHETQRPYIATVVHQKSSHVVYVWDEIGAFVRSFTMTRRSGADAVGSVDRFGAGAQQLFVASAVSSTLQLQFYLPDGTPDALVASGPLRKNTVGYTYAQMSGSDVPQLLLGSSARSGFRFDAYDARGALATSTMAIGAIGTWRSLYFGR